MTGWTGNIVIKYNDSKTVDQVVKEHFFNKKPIIQPINHYFNNTCDLVSYIVKSGHLANVMNMCYLELDEYIAINELKVSTWEEYFATNPIDGENELDRFLDHEDYSDYDFQLKFERFFITQGPKYDE